ncbi:11848_t:CDS:2 [Acaulospora colombiana]|uniref:11848_t:CDS:1 n=1 Tax=Acaulospora colombiana TaxID=27376 RepID=A0ACA9K0J3_9GLOM|nr:11848_t:CDS:2 [Acaulospora colombiana]
MSRGDDILRDSSPETQVMGSNKNRLYQYAIEHGMSPNEFSIIAEAERNEWTMCCFREELERNTVVQ